MMTNKKHRVAIRAGDAGDWSVVRALLSDAGLPIEDLDAASMGQFLIAMDETASAQTVLGAVALQCFGRVGLLRSLVVASSARSTGCGWHLLRTIERIAVDSGVSEIWLLTTDADGFFAGHGYRRVSRDTAAPAIRETPEFSSLCPANAVLMVKSTEQKTSPG